MTFDFGSLSLAEPDFSADTAIEKAFFDTGFRRNTKPRRDGPLRIGASNHPGVDGEVAVAALAPLTSRRYAIALAAFPREVLTHLASEFATEATAIICPDAGTLTRALRRTWQIVRSLPATPLHAFHKALTAEGIVPDAPPTTEAERLIRIRLGQRTFRAALLDYWGGACPLTGVTEPALLRASHIVPWAQCGSDAERLDVHNGLLLSALWDAAFDKGLVTFTDDGRPQASPHLTASTSALFGLDAVPPLLLTDGHRRALAHHRAQVFARARQTDATESDADGGILSPAASPSSTEIDEGLHSGSPR